MPDINNIFDQPTKEKTTAQVIAEELIEMCNNGQVIIGGYSPTSI